MPKMTIEVSDAVHLKLLELQFKRKTEKQKRTSLAELASDVLEEHLLKNEKAPPK